ncbi:MAG: class I SAM-dependent methyltransferase [Bacteroidota bacterium]|nr:class I SAM-dependent methyltransferase [Bacteroidota bacterium]
MKRILHKLKDPSRVAAYFAIKFLNRKINAISEIEAFFKQKKGLEIGGPSRIFAKNGYIPIYPLANNIDGVNFSTNTVWENTIAEGKTYNFGGDSQGYQYIKDGTDLSIIQDNAYDFVLSSHSLEHIANPIKALKEWIRVLKKGGALLLVLPDSKHTFDRNRPITQFEHLLEDFKNNTDERDLTHLDEILSLHETSYDPGINNLEEFKKRCIDNYSNRCLHHHVFDIQLLKQILIYLDLKVVTTDVAPPFNLIVIAVKLK